MASLKDLKNRIGSVKNTQKITKAMKMVAAAKLRRAKDHAEAARPYAESLEFVLQSLTASIESSESLPKLLKGTGKSDVHLLVVATADRGLCGGFNSSIVKEARKRIEQLQAEGKTVKIFCVGKKGAEQLSSTHKNLIIKKMRDLYKTKPEFSIAQDVAQKVEIAIEEYDVDVCSIIYSKFESAISQLVTMQQLMPMEIPEDPLQEQIGSASAYEFEPEEDKIISDLVPRNFTTQIFRAMLENAASEQGARMTAMDNATRNAGEMIKDLTLLYNRSRQAAITKELIEIISGAEAV